MEDKDLNIVENQAAIDTKVNPTNPEILTESKIPEVNSKASEKNNDSKWDSVLNKIDAGEMSLGGQTINRIEDNVVDFDPDDYRKYLGPNVFLPDATNPMLSLDRDRARNQSFGEQFGGALAQAIAGEIIGGSIEALGYTLDLKSIADVISGEETEWGNFLTRFGQSIREGTEEATRIYQDPTRPEGFLNGMGDSAWWLQNSVSVASTLSMLLPSMGAVKAASFLGKSLSRGLGTINKSLDVASKMGVKAKWMTEGISQAIVSRNIENFMEAHGTFDAQKQELLQKINKNTGEKYTEEEATQIASEAASENWRNGWAMLLQDIPQYLAIGKVFNPISKKMESALSNASKAGVASKLKPWQQKVGAFGSTFVSEGMEEAYQFIISERAKLHSDLRAGLITEEEFDEQMKKAYSSEELKTSAFFGGLGGNIFQIAGKGLNEVFKSKDRKEYEKNIGEVYTQDLKNRANQLHVLQQELAKADQNEVSPEQREGILDTIIMNMTAEALEKDMYDSFVETINGISNMSEADVKNIEEMTGGEFSVELAKEYTPKLLERSAEMRSRYLKHRNKISSPQIASKIARLEMDNKAWEGKRGEPIDRVAKIKESMGDVWSSFASDIQKAEWERSENKKVLEKRIENLKAHKISTVGKTKKDVVSKVIELNEARLKEVNDEISEAKKMIEAMSPAEKKDYKKNNLNLVQEAYENVAQEIIDAKEYEAAINDKIAMNNYEISYLKSEEGQSEYRKKAEIKRIKLLDTEEKINEALSTLDENKNLTDSEKADVIETLQGKLKQIEKEKKEAIEKESIRKDAESHKKKDNERNNDPTSVDNQKRNVISDNFEDHNFDEEVDVTELILNKQDDVVDKKSKSSRSIPLLDRVAGTKNYQKWVENTKEKIGEEFEYEVTKPSRLLKTNKRAKEVIKMFNEAEEGNIPQEVYDYLPITAQYSGSESVFTFLPQKPKDTDPAIFHERYNNNYRNQRKIIIDRLKAGESTKAKVKYSKGGELVVDENVDGMSPENSLLDLQQINSVDDVEFLFTDDFGNIIDTGKKIDIDFAGRVISVGQDSDNNLMPYKGGVFLKVRKADGFPFPLRLNLLKNTKEQAEVISELLIDVAVSTKDEKTGKTKKKLLSLDSLLDDARPELKEKIKEVMGPELELLGENPNINDLINLFVYVSDKTEGLTSELYFDGKDLVFAGEQGSENTESRRITPDSRNSSELREQLVDFLVNKKRRQVSLNMLNNLDGYKKYIIENKIVSTNGTIKGPLFQNKSNEKKEDGSYGRRIQLYLEPLSPLSEKINESEVSAERKDIIERKNKTIDVGLNVNPVTGEYEAIYYYPKSRIKTMSYPTLDEALERYDNELKSLDKKEESEPKSKKVSPISNDFKSEEKPKNEVAIPSETKKAKIEEQSQQSSDKLTLPKNVFTVQPRQSADKKAKSKAKISTQYIGFGEGVPNSSTDLYAKQAGKYANTGNYNSSDIIFVSVPGKRGSAELQKKNQNKTIKEAIKAVESGATIVTDNKSYIDSSSYNTGEKRLYKNMEAKGYNYSEITVDGNILGTWSKSSTQQSNKVKLVNEVYDKISDDIYSLSLNYKGKEYSMVIDRDGEITDASYYNPNTLKDVDVKSSFFKFSSEDIKNIFSEIEQLTQQPSATQKTQSKNVIVSPSKGRSPQPDGVVAYRTKGTSEKDMIEALKDNVVGNPFGPYAAIKDDSVVSSIRFGTWLQGTSDTDVMQDYRKAIINKGLELRGKKIYYYKELGRLSHANFLDYFLNESNFLDKYHSQQSSDTVFGKKQEDFVSLRARRKKMKNIKPIGDVGSNQFKDKNTGEIKKECPK